MAQSFFIHIFLMNGTVIFAQVTGVNRFLHRDFFHTKKYLRIFINMFFNKNIIDTEIFQMIFFKNSIEAMTYYINPG